MKYHDAWKIKAGPNRSRVDWKRERDRIDLAEVATRLLGPAPGRRGERGRRLWWRCPLHDDKNPSFWIEPGKPWWRCYGCDQYGDAATLVRKVLNCTFPEAMEYLTGGSGTVAGRHPSRAPNGPANRPAPVDPAEPSGTTEADALALIDAAAARLWTGAGAESLSTLRARGLSDETIRAARLGHVARFEARTRDGRPYGASGIVVPWYDRGRLVLVKIRQRDGRQPKYAEVFRAVGWRGGLYPGPEAIRLGRPVGIVEGEFDALLLGQEIESLGVGVVTLGSASAKPELSIILPMLAASVWYVATDRDDAGEKAFEAWAAFNARARRLRPPELIGQPCKDWTDCYLSGVPLLRLWSNRLTPPPSPPSWEELAAQVWVDDSDDEADSEVPSIIDPPTSVEESEANPDQPY